MKTKPYTNSLKKSYNYHQEGKILMFRIAFDSSKKEHDQIRQIFSKTMSYINDYKRTNGYKHVSNLLQKAEAKLMIDVIF